MKKISVITLSTLLFYIAPFTVNAEQVSKHLSTIVQPEPIERVHPKYPRNAAMAKREGWAKLSFIIEKDGSVSNILENETSGSADFTKASIKAVSQWKYKPAFENGEPIQQCVNSVQMNFRIDNKEGEKGVRKRFLLKHKVAKEYLLNKDYERVKSLLEEMGSLKKRHMSENNYLNLLWSDYQNAIGNKDKELFHLYRVSLDILPEKRQLSVLHSMFMLELAQNKFRNAHSTYLTLSKLPSAKPYLENYQKLINKIDEAIGGDENIIIKANIHEKDYWQYQLVRNEFSLVNVEGNLTKLDVRCANKRHVYTVEENNTWTIPKAWANCHLYIYGEDNTTFNLVEHPFKNKA